MAASESRAHLWVAPAALALLLFALALFVGLHDHAHAPAAAFAAPTSVRGLQRPHGLVGRAPPSAPNPRQAPMAPRPSAREALGAGHGGHGAVPGAGAYAFPDPAVEPRPAEQLLSDIAIDVGILGVALGIAGLFAAPSAGARRSVALYATAAGAAGGKEEKDLEMEVTDGQANYVAPSEGNWFQRQGRRLRTSMRNNLNRKQLMKLGVFVLLSYGCVSNCFVAMTFSTAWYLHCVQYGLTPLAAGQWSKFLLIYVGCYAVNNLLRPLRVSIAIAIAPYFEKAVHFLEKKTGFGRRASSALLVFLVNVCGTCSLLFFGASVATVAAGLQ